MHGDKTDAPGAQRGQFTPLQGIMTDRTPFFEICYGYRPVSKSSNSTSEFSIAIPNPDNMVEGSYTVLGGIAPPSANRGADSRI